LAATIKYGIRKMKTLKAITGREFRITSNKSKRTFTIKTDVATYRTYPMTKEEFNSCEYNTGNDWMHFLNSNDYYKVR
jgi:hypothetical protein